MDSNPRSPVYGELAAPGRAEARHELVEKLRARGIEAIQGNAAAPEAIPRLRPPHPHQVEQTSHGPVIPEQQATLYLRPRA
jgi:hypothetical protein